MLVNLCIQLFLKLPFSFRKVAFWQMTRWQDLQICEKLLLIKTTKGRGWAEQGAGDWQLAAFISSSASRYCWCCRALKKNAHRTGLYYEIIIYMLNVTHQICFATCWNWFRTQCSPPFYLSGAAHCKGHPWGATGGEKPCPRQYAFQPRGCTAASDSLPLLYSLCSKQMIRMIRTQGHSFFMFMSAVLIPLVRDLGQSISLLSTSNRKKKR